MSIDDVRIIELPKYLDARGNLSFAENNNQIPFTIKRTYWLYDVPGGVARGGHAEINNEELVIALSGSFDILVDDVVVMSVNNTGKYRISEFKYETYPIPAELLKGKKQVRVKFQAKPRKQIGEIYEVRLVKN